MDELGCDVSVVYPSTGLAFFQLPIGGAAPGACRALNRYHRDAFDGCTDRLVPVAAVPANDPGRKRSRSWSTQSVELGLSRRGHPELYPPTGSGITRACGRRRPSAGRSGSTPTASTPSTTTTRSGAVHRARRLGRHPQPGQRHSASVASPTNWVYNHIGHFAASGEALCKSLFLGGVTRRFPELRVGILEGGRRMGVQPLQRPRGPLGEAQRQGNPREFLDPATAGEVRIQRARGRVRPGRPGHQPTRSPARC